MRPPLIERWGRIDILHNNVGVSIAGGDKPLDELTEAAFDHVSAINLRGTIMGAAVGATTAAAATAATANAYPASTYNYYPPPYYSLPPW